MRRLSFYFQSMFIVLVTALQAQQIPPTNNTAFRYLKFQVDKAGTSTINYLEVGEVEWMVGTTAYPITKFTTNTTLVTSSATGEWGSSGINMYDGKINQAWVYLRERPFPIWATLDNTTPIVPTSIKITIRPDCWFAGFSCYGSNDNINWYLLLDKQNYDKASTFGSGLTEKTVEFPIPAQLIDNQPPAVPTNIVASNVTSRSFDLTWSPSVDNEGGVGFVTYEIYVDGKLRGTTQNTSYSVTGLSGNTFIVTIKAKDGAMPNNVSEASAPLIVQKYIDPVLNNEPSMGQIMSKLYANRGQQIITLPQISDGEIDKKQTVTISVVSTTPELLTIDSVSYKQGNKVAFVYVKDQGKIGKASIEITITDDGGTAGGGKDKAVFNEQIDIQAFKNPCANFVEYDTQHWQPRPSQNDFPTPGSYQKICTTNSPIEDKARDFFWMKMYGYIIPSKTEYYNFQGFSNEGFDMFMNLNGGPESDWSKLTSLVEGATSIWTSEAYLLEEGKPYYFEVYGRDIVNTQPLWLKWTSASTPLSFISNENLAPFYDIVKPTVPQNFSIQSIGLSDVLVSWSPSTDNRNNLQGYNVFIDGELVNISPVKETSYKIQGLTPGRTYNVHVVSVDDSENNSYPSQVLTFKTYIADDIPPTVPTNLSSEFVTAFSVKLKWNKSTDAETEVRGYNIYQNNVLVNELVKDTTVLVIGLTEKSNYSFTVEAVDANYNKSPKSAAYNVSTVAFDPNETRDGIRKGRVSIKLNPLTKFEGFGINLNYRKTGLLSANLITFGDFEGSQTDTMNVNNLKYYDKQVFNTGFVKDLTTPYEGKVAAKLSPIAGGYFRCVINTSIDKRYTYLVRFAMKKDASFTGVVNVDLKGMFSGTTNKVAVTPTTSWQMYEVELTTTFEGAEPTWYLDFTSTSNGTYYLDNIQFVEKGSYVEGSKFSKRAMDLLRDFKPAHVRWGAIEANSENFKNNSGVGTGYNFSYADWIELANQLNAKAFITVGVGPKTDFYLSPAATFKKFVEYIAGDATTAGGILRTAEGYGNLLSKNKGLMIELGNEVWGGAAHQAGNFNDYTAYGTWARSVATTMKSTSGFDPNKIKVAYSGRYPGQNYGLHKILLSEDKGEGDVLAISGYMGGNLNLDPAIPLKSSLLDYHKASIKMLQTNLEGLKSEWREMLATCNRLLPMYMYEGNMTTDSYNGSLGQAVTFADYYTTVPLYGVPDVSVFSFESGQWRIIEDRISLKPLPLFTIGKYINKYCTGSMLETEFTTSYKIKDEKGIDLKIEPVGARAYTDSTSYSIALFSRDFENDYQVQVDIPDFIGNSSICKMIRISGTNFDDREAIVEERIISDFADSLIITVPKYSVVILHFEGNDQHFTPPAVYQSYKKVTSVKITQAENKYYIDTKRGKLALSALVLPEDAFSKIVKWTLLDNETVKAYFVESGSGIMLYGSGVSSGNGTIRVVCAATDLSGKADTVSIVISNQGPSALDSFEAEIVEMHPNPAKDYLRVTMPQSQAGQFFVLDLSGKIHIRQTITGNEQVLNIKSLKPGMYLLRISTLNGTKTLKFIKQESPT
ncbi:MAG TPA: fibronectin type III domain-containing protein [Paludibacteraceae bacterium]|nr:fibronectin type III domain-containing protein [Paludibacteraceae bacterium]HPD59383.1 fibronectin type III domain-containing protein [Paludibacteraceae bacterium]HRS23984.1 fibronectin type III domain-containing protein [Paludibacteraceae bacterium]HRT78883.1 fibronectin type III domain-containing protein [Paludibacteraceae bacterium]